MLRVRPDRGILSLILSQELHFVGINDLMLSFEVEDPLWNDFFEIEFLPVVALLNYERLLKLLRRERVKKLSFVSICVFQWCLNVDDLPSQFLKE